MSADIFFSYDTDDRERVRPIVAMLEARGWKVFWDRDIRTGSGWRNAIATSLAGARCVVVAWSRHSIESTWVHEEADEGMRRKILVPICIDDVAPPIGFRSVQAAMLATWDGTAEHSAFRKLLEDMDAILTRPERPMGATAAFEAAEEDARRQFPGGGGGEGTGAAVSKWAVRYVSGQVKGGVKVAVVAVLIAMGLSLGWSASYPNTPLSENPNLYGLFAFAGVVLGSVGVWLWGFVARRLGKRGS